MYRFWFFLTVCIYGILAFHVKDEFEYLNNWMHNDDTATENRNKSAKCKKDILLVVDTSWSIGNDFNKNVKPFLKNLVTNSFLNVGPDGTRIGLVIFGQQDKTKKVFDMGEITIANELARRMNDALDYSSVGGSYTRTDLGLKLANGIFTQHDPLNHRSTVGDIVILMTDGAPRGKTDTIKKTKEEAQKLKDKNILLIVAAVGPDRKKFKPLMEELATSPDNVLEADFRNMSNIIKKLVASSCIKPGKPPCTCSNMKDTKTIEPGKSTVEVNLTVFPPPNCEGGDKVIKEKTEVKPQLPREFPAGVHVVNLTFFLENSRFPKLFCSIKVKVRGTCKCKETAPITLTIPPGKSTVELNLPTQPPICENGAKVKKLTGIIPQIPRELPVGSHEFNYTFTLQKVKDKKITCPIEVHVKGTCKCKEIAPITLTIAPGKSTVELDLRTQPPICENGAEVKELTEIIPQIPQELPVGSYEFNYIFTLKKTSDKKITCPIKVQVKEFEGTCSCDKNGKTITRSISSESSAAKVTLDPPPITCTHDAKVISATVAAPATNRFPAGKHIVNFKAFLGKAKDSSIICPLIIEVKVLCDGVPYDPKEKLCCCGKIHQKKTGYECCGKHYYNPNTMKCCGNSNLYTFQESC